MKSEIAKTILFAVLMPLFFSEFASAQVISLPSGTAIARIGMVSGTAIVRVQTTGGSCLTTHTLGAGGLQAQVWVDGRDEAGESIATFSTTTTFCGVSMAPLITNGFKISLFGWGGNDKVTSLVAEVSGGDGNDTLRSDRVGAIVAGGAGSDWVTSGVSSATLAGNNDNDTICVLAPITSVLKIDGGSGTDTRCGSATTITNIEGVNCPICSP